MQALSSPDRAAADQLTRAGIAALKAGNRAGARDLLARATVADPAHEQAWLWLSGAVTNDTDRLRCLQSVLVINPNNESAHRGLALLLDPREPTAPVLPDTVPIPAPPVAPPPVPTPPSPTRHAAGLTPEAQAAVDFVLNRMGNHVGRDTVVRELAEHLGCEWEQAEQIVVYVETERRTTLAARQSPLLLFFGVVTLLTGSVLALRAGVFMYHELQTIGLPDPRSIGTFGTGLAMIGGSTMGMWQTIRALW